jgi:hypothetical protein
MSGVITNMRGDKDKDLYLHSIIIISIIIKNILSNTTSFYYDCLTHGSRSGGMPP